MVKRKIYQVYTLALDLLLAKDMYSMNSYQVHKFICASFKITKFWKYI